MKILYQKILNEKWDSVMELLEVESHALEVQDTLNGDLPLHMALERNAPVNVIQALIGLYPDAISQTNSKGLIPLHVATKAKVTKDILDVLILAFPEGLKVHDTEGLLPKQHAVPHERPELFRPCVCWESQRRKEKKMDHHEDMFQILDTKLTEINDNLVVRDTLLKELKTRYHEVYEKMKDVTVDSTEEIEAHFLKLDSLHQEVDKFVENVNSRVTAINNSIDEKAEISLKTKSDHAKQQYENTNAYKELQPLMVQLRVETRELIEISSKVRGISSARDYEP